MEYTFQEILDVGLEIEFNNVKRDTNDFVDNLYKKLNNFKVVHDASAESPEITLANIPIQFFNKEGKNNKLLSILKFKKLETIGGELNSPILAGNNFKEHIYRLIDFLREMGESFSTTEQDSRGSIHVHINVGKDIRHKHLIRLLELGLATEAIFYRLGGMGNINRGVKNSFVYQRPLTLPPCVHSNGKYYPIFDYKDLLESSNKTDFYMKYGDTVNQIKMGNHYVTQRYTGLNFYSIPYRGSIEFRYANKVLIPEWIIAWILLCQSFVNFALTKNKDESFENEYRKLEDNKNYSDDEVYFIFDKLNIQDDYKMTLMDIWHETTIPTFDGKNLLSHLDSPSFFLRETPYCTTPVTNITKSNVINVRNLSEKKQSILSNLNMENKEVDYIINDYGVRNKIKENYQRLDNNQDDVDEALLRLDDETIKNFFMAGLNIENYDIDDARKFAEKRILTQRFLPFRVLRFNWWYQFPTRYEDLDISIRVKTINRQFEFIAIDTRQDISSEVKKYYPNYKVAFKSFGYDFTELIDYIHNNMDEFFDYNDDNNEDNNNIIGDEWELNFDNDNNIQERGQ